MKKKAFERHCLAVKICRQYVKKNMGESKLFVGGWTALKGENVKDNFCRSSALFGWWGWGAQHRGAAGERSGSWGP
jgi:hypothetical protein